MNVDMSLNLQVTWGPASDGAKESGQDIAVSMQCCMLLTTTLRPRLDKPPCRGQLEQWEPPYHVRGRGLAQYGCLWDRSRGGKTQGTPDITSNHSASKEAQSQTWQNSMLLIYATLGLASRLYLSLLLQGVAGIGGHRKRPEATEHHESMHSTRYSIIYGMHNAVLARCQKGLSCLRNLQCSFCGGPQRLPARTSAPQGLCSPPLHRSAIYGLH